MADVFELTREGDTVTLAFLDLDGAGVAYTMPLRDARQIRDALNTLVDDTPTG